MIGTLLDSIGAPARSGEAPSPFVLLQLRSPAHPLPPRHSLPSVRLLRVRQHCRGQRQRWDDDDEMATRTNG
jgi:hypothetical protein